MGIPNLRRLGTSPFSLNSTMTTNLYTPDAGKIAIVRQIHVVNVTTNDDALTLFLGGNAGNTAGTELFKGKIIKANDVYDWYGLLKLSAGDFLVGGCVANEALTLTFMGEEFLAQD